MNKYHPRKNILKTAIYFFIFCLLISPIAMPPSGKNVEAQVPAYPEELLIDRETVITSQHRVQVIHWNKEFQDRVTFKSDEDGRNSCETFLELQYVAGDKNRKLFCIMPWTGITANSVGRPRPRTTVEEILSQNYHYLARPVEEITEDLREISYFAYGYKPQEERDIDDFAAVQFLSWEAIGFTVAPGAGHSGCNLEWYQGYPYEVAKAREIWRKSASFEGQEITIQPGDRMVLTDENGLLEYFMRAAGYSPGVEQEVGGEGSDLFLTWVEPNELQIYAGTKFKDSVLVEFAISEPSTFFAYDDGESQAVMTAEEYLPHDPISFRITSSNSERRGSLKLKKSAPVLSDWQVETVAGQEIYKPVYTEAPLADCAFTLLCREEVSYGGKKYAAGTFSISELSDENGEIIFRDIPAAEYILTETSCPQAYVLNSEPIEVTIYEGSFDEENMPILEVRNSLKHLKLKGKKVLKDCQELSSEQVKDSIDNIRFALRVKEGYPGASINLPEGGIVDLSGFKVLNYPPPESKEGEIWGELNFNIPFLGAYDLLELNSGEFHKPMDKRELSLAEFPAGMEEEEECTFELSEVLYNELKPQNEDPSEEPSEKPSEDPRESETEKPSEIPSEEPSEEPSEKSSEKPSEKVTEDPSEKPSGEPKPEPSSTPRPSEEKTEPSKKIDTHIVAPVTVSPNNPPPQNIYVEAPQNHINVQQDQAENPKQGGYEPPVRVGSYIEQYPEPSPMQVMRLPSTGIGSADRGKIFVLCAGLTLSLILLRKSYLS